MQNETALVEHRISLFSSSSIDFMFSGLRSAACEEPMREDKINEPLDLGACAAEKSALGER